MLLFSFIKSVRRCKQLGRDQIKQDCLLVEGRAPANTIHRHAFCSCDLDLDPVFLTYRVVLDILKMCLHVENKLFRLRISEVRTLEADISETDEIERITSNN